MRARLKRVFQNGRKLEGTHVYLRPITLRDAGAAYCRWMTDPIINRFTESRHTRTTFPALKKYVRDTLKNPANIFLAIVESETNLHIGNIKIHSSFGPAWYHGAGDVGLIIGERRCHGKGYGTEAIKLVKRLAFDHLGLRKLTASCYSNNVGSARAFLKAGFRKEGVRPRNARCGGKVVDLLLFGAINPRLKS
jgi:RimJ/RimL family protein N-acetyltransferase